jgi:hypothetical protein
MKIMKNEKWKMENDPFLTANYPRFFLRSYSLYRYLKSDPVVDEQGVVSSTLVADAVANIEETTLRQSD